MANFCLMIQYDGTRYNGWQRQGNTSNTIQEKLETILEQLYGEPCRSEWLRPHRCRRTCTAPDRQFPDSAHHEPLFLPENPGLF